MKLRNILAAAALVAAIGTQAEGQKYVILHNPEVDLSTLKGLCAQQVGEQGWCPAFQGTWRR